MLEFLAGWLMGCLLWVYCYRTLKQVQEKTSSLRSKFVEVLESLQVLSRLSQVQIARELGVSPQTVTNIKTGKRNPSEEIYNKLLELQQKQAPGTPPAAPDATGPAFIRVELKSGNVFNLPIPSGPGGYVRAIEAAGALDRASRLEQASVEELLARLKAAGIQVAGYPTPPAPPNGTAPGGRQ
jgi:transcriptional regulator with XRE-family HTH domain